MIAGGVAADSTPGVDAHREGNPTSEAFLLPEPRWAGRSHDSGLVAARSAPQHESEDTMRHNTQHRTLSIFSVPICLTAVASLALPAAAMAITPTVTYGESVSGYNSSSPKMAAAQCPVGWSVLGGTAALKGQEGQVAIQSAFPIYDAGLGRHIFVVKAAEDLSQTNGNWSVSAGAYCTNTTAATIVMQSSSYDSDSIKSAAVTCTMYMRVVGMGSEVSTSADPPARLVGTTPPPGVVFRGVEVDDDLTTVTARATEVGAATDDSWGANWQITAIAACALPLYFD